MTVANQPPQNIRREIVLAGLSSHPLLDNHSVRICSVRLNKDEAQALELLPLLRNSKHLLLRLSYRGMDENFRLRGEDGCMGK